MSRAEIYYKFDLNFQNMSIINILYFEYECEQNTKLLNDKKSPLNQWLKSHSTGETWKIRISCES